MAKVVAKEKVVPAPKTAKAAVGSDKNMEPPPILIVDQVKNMTDAELRAHLMKAGKKVSKTAINEKTRPTFEKQYLDIVGGQGVDVANALLQLFVDREDSPPVDQQPAVSPAGKAPPAGNIEMSPLLKGETIRERWIIEKRLGGGGFGDIYEAYDNKISDWVAIKVEPAGDPKQVLKMEVAVLRRLQDKDHACRFYGSGRTDVFNYMVMSLCAKSLSELRRSTPHGYFSMSTSVRLTMQTLKAIEDVHNIGFIHRDIKPSNFAIGRKDADKKTVFILDFGLARQYVNPKGEHRAPRSAAGFRGTIRYASLAPHTNQEMGRIDDIWSLYYMLIEFIRGSLPWRRLKDRDSVRIMKEKLGPDYLVRDMPTPLKQFSAKLQEATYADKPDYVGFQDCLKRSLESLGSKMDDPLDWENDFRDCQAKASNWSIEKMSELEAQYGAAGGKSRRKSKSKRKAGGASARIEGPRLFHTNPLVPMPPPRYPQFMDDYSRIRQLSFPTHHHQRPLLISRQIDIERWTTA